MKNKGDILIIQNERPPNLITGPHHRTVSEQGMGRSALWRYLYIMPVHLMGTAIHQPTERKKPEDINNTIWSSNIDWLSVGALQSEKQNERSNHFLAYHA
jgi:hypothetical protein